MEERIVGSTRSSLPENGEEIKRKIKRMLGGLANFLGKYLPSFKDPRTREKADCFIKGLLSPLPRKTAEPIAELWDRERKTIQRFVGGGNWDDALIEKQMVKEIAEKLGSPKGVISVDPSGFPKQGKHSVGVARQSGAATWGRSTIARLEFSPAILLPKGTPWLESGCIFLRNG